MSDARCPRCGKVLQIGDFPFCKRGPSDHGPYGISVIDDAIEGGPRWFETMGPDPVWIDSKSQWKREVAVRELVQVDKHDRAYYNRRFRMHDEERRDIGTNQEY